MGLRCFYRFGFKAPKEKVKDVRRSTLDVRHKNKV